MASNSAVLLLQVLLFFYDTMFMEKKRMRNSQSVHNIQCIYRKSGHICVRYISNEKFFAQTNLANLNAPMKFRTCYLLYQRSFLLWCLFAVEIFRGINFQVWGQLWKHFNRENLTIYATNSHTYTCMYMHTCTINSPALEWPKVCHLGWVVLGPTKQLKVTIKAISWMKRNTVKMKV